MCRLFVVLLLFVFSYIVVALILALTKKLYSFVGINFFIWGFARGVDLIVIFVFDSIGAAISSSLIPKSNLDCSLIAGLFDDL